MQAITWLENYLKRLAIPMVIVSHDREFLNQLANKIVDTDEGVTTSYLGNYAKAMRRKKANLARQVLEWEKQQKEIARLVGSYRLGGRPPCSMLCTSGERKLPLWWLAKQIWG